MARKFALQNILFEDCGSCHGITLRGGLGPPLLASRFYGVSDDFLIETILEGRPGTPMPAWKSILSRDEAGWIVRLFRQRPES